MDVAEQNRKDVRTYYYAHREEVLAKRRAYYLRTRDARRAEKTRSRLRVRGADMSTVPASLVPPSTCDLCGRSHKKICADHDHETGRFRGWLCDACNRALGLLGDNPEVLLRAASYLRRCLHLT